VIVESSGGTIRLVALGIGSRDHFTFSLKEGTSASVWPRFQDQGAVIVSEPYAYRHGVGVGSMLILRTDHGDHAFPVAGVFYDYASDQGAVLMSRRTYDRFWDDRGVSALAFRADPGTNVPRLADALRREVRGVQDVLIQSNRALRDASLAIFDRTFAITTVLRLLATLVAFLGVLSALMAIQLERVREVAVLRAHGLTPGQVWGLVTSQAGLTGLLAGALAIPVGIVVALVLILIVNRRSFGWTLQVHIAPEVLVEAVLLALGAAILAGLIPAAKMARIRPALALRGE
jgi:putative ABC transport system permease protein